MRYILCDNIGSHSAAFTAITPPLSNFFPSFKYVGNPAPPSPTSPDSSTSFIGSISLSDSYFEKSVFYSLMIISVSLTESTVPSTLEKILAPSEVSGLFAMSCPLCTCSFGTTIDSEAAPICCFSGKTNFICEFPPLT